MEFKVLYIPADPSFALEKRTVTDVETMSALVGGHLETVTLDDPPGVMYVNEEGKLQNLPLNQRATELVQRHNPALKDVIVGNAFVCGQPDENGDDTDCPEAYIGRTITIRELINPTAVAWRWDHNGVESEVCWVRRSKSLLLGRRVDEDSWSKPTPLEGVVLATGTLAEAREVAKKYIYDS